MLDHNIDARKRELSKKQFAYANNRAKGMTRERSALLADYSGSDLKKAADRAEAMPHVQDELARIRSSMAAEAGMTKEQVLAMLIDASEMAKLMSDPGAMISAARELGKMLGFYAPEVKTHLHELGSKAAAALKTMSDAELMKLSHGKVVDGEVLSVTTNRTAAEDVPDVPPE